MATGLRFGVDAKLYYNTGSYGTPTWTVINNVGDLDFASKFDEADANTRGVGAAKAVEPTQREFQLSFEMLEDMDDTVFVALLAAYHAKTKKDFFVCSGAYNASGENYARSECKIVDMALTEPLNGINKYKVTIKRCYTTNAAQFGVVA